MATITYISRSAENVAIAGDFGEPQWAPVSMRRLEMDADGNQVWGYDLLGSPGEKHQYKFVVDGKWVLEESDKPRGWKEIKPTSDLIR
jgi:hypothetical protein